MGYKAPCMGCERRGCGAYHDVCEKYIEYRKLKEKEYANRIENLKAMEDIRNAVERMKRRGKK